MKCPKCNFIFETKGRSNNQNRYYFGVVIATLSEFTGFTPDEMHEVTKHKFLRGVKNIKTKNGVLGHVFTKSTSSMTTVEMEEYLSRIRQWASIDLGINIQEPNEGSGNEA